MATTVTQTVDTREYAWSDITVLIGGKPITGIQEVSFKANQKKEAVYGKGNQPLCLQPGQIDYSGQLTLLQSELETLEAAATDGSLLSLNVDIMVNFGNPPQPIRTFLLKGCQFTTAERKISNSETFMKVTLPFIYLRQEVVA